MTTWPVDLPRSPSPIPHAKIWNAIWVRDRQSGPGGTTESFKSPGCTVGLPSLTSWTTTPRSCAGPQSLEIGQRQRGQQHARLNACPMVSLIMPARHVRHFVTHPVPGRPVGRLQSPPVPRSSRKHKSAFLRLRPDLCGRSMAGSYLPQFGAHACRAPAVAWGVAPRCLPHAAISLKFRGGLNR